MEIIHGDIWQSVENLYNACMDKTKKISAVAAASRVHFFLKMKMMMLEKRFIIFTINMGQNHWVTSICCNPWYTVARRMKKMSQDAVPDVIDKMDEFAHGWLMFDPIRGFLGDSDIKDVDKK